MSLRSFFKNLKQRYDEKQFEKAMETLKQSGFHTIRLDEELHMSFIKEKDVIEFDVSSKNRDRKSRFEGFVELLDELHGQHQEFEVDGSKVMFWKI